MGERSNIERLVKRYGDALVRFAYCRTGNSAEAEDIAEDAFVALFLKNKTFENEAQEKAYLFKTVANKCCDYHRKKARAWVPLSDLETCLVSTARRKPTRSATAKRSTAVCKLFPRNTGKRFVCIISKDFRPTKSQPFCARTRKAFTICCRAPKPPSRFC